MAVRLSVLKLKISVTPGLYSSENIDTGLAVVLGYFLEGLDTPPPPQKKKIQNFFHFFCKKNYGESYRESFLDLTSPGAYLTPRGLGQSC